MMVNWIRTGALLLLISMIDAGVSTAQTGAVQTPGFVLRVASLDQLLKGLFYLAEMVDKKEESRQAEAFLKSLTGAKGLEGIDLNRPFGIYGTMTPGIIDSTLVVAIPIADEATAIAMLQRIGYRGEKQEDGSYKIDIPNSPYPGYYRFANKTVYITLINSSAIAVNKLLPVENALPEDPSLLGLTLQIEQIPATLRKMALGTIEARLADARSQNQPNETGNQKKLRQETLDLAVKSLRALLEEGKALHLGLHIDPKANAITSDITLTPKKGSPSAEFIHNLSQSKSLGTSLDSRNYAIQTLISASLPQTLRPIFASVVDEALTKIPTGKLHEAAREIVAELIPVLSPTLKMGELDLGVTIRKEAKGEHYTALAVVKINQGTTIEKTIKELFKKVPPGIQKELTLDADQVGSVMIHKFPPPKTTEGFKQLYGTDPVYVAIRDGSLLVALGEEALPALKQSIGAQPGPNQPLTLKVAWNQAKDLLAQGEPKAIPAAKKAFTQDPPQDQLSLTVQGGDQLRIQLQVQGPVLMFFTLMDQLKKKEL